MSYFVVARLRRPVWASTSTALLVRRTARPIGLSCRWAASNRYRTHDGIVLPEGWVEHSSPAKGRYFSHPKTGVTQFEKPTGPPTEKQIRDVFNMKYGEQIAELRPGMKVMLKGLVSAPQLNGKEGVAEAWEPSGKIRVRLSTGELKAVKPQFVMAATMERKAAAATSQPSGDSSSASSQAHSEPREAPADSSTTMKIAKGCLVFGSGLAIVWLVRSLSLARRDASVPRNDFTGDDSSRPAKSSRASSQSVMEVPSPPPTAKRRTEESAPTTAESVVSTTAAEPAVAGSPLAEKTSSIHISAPADELATVKMPEILVKQVSAADLVTKGVFDWAIWESNAAQFEWQYAATEEGYILQGEATVKPTGEYDNLSEVHLHPGDYCVMPCGLTAKWTVTEAMRKHYNYL
eukprot:TRINITY_DN22579_c0_g1_i2.p1 TRINITY_DN22579_c0_g1~~TRINITY_DN22579_c0_g1_i2.p1  ORF type:complete len:405 (-),score=62.75 TRINITY_DN22579_c0_g1_i2:343-1557(-)